MQCPKCKYEEYLPRYTHIPNQIAAHCANCGAFIKWLNKDERMVLIAKQQQEFNNFCMQHKAMQEIDRIFTVSNGEKDE